MKKTLEKRSSPAFSFDVYTLPFHCCSNHHSSRQKTYAKNLENDRHRTFEHGALQRDDKRQRCDLDFSIIHSCVDADDVDEDENDDVIRIRLSLSPLGVL